MPSADKARFLERFQKEGKTTLKWAAEFTQTEGLIKETVDSVGQGWMNKTELFIMVLSLPSHDTSHSGTYRSTTDYHCVGEGRWKAKPKQTRNQILAINSFNPADLGEKLAIEICAELLKTAEEQFRYRAQFKEHPRMDILNLYYYMHKKDSIDSERQYNAETLSEKADAKGLKNKLLTEGAASSSSTLAIKVENPAWQTVLLPHPLHTHTDKT